MLIAGLFSDAALAGDGDGSVTVGWAGDSNDSRDINIRPLSKKIIVIQHI
jgi:hypothetical protein